jgi:putative addiction module component (TIGR02574 family)
VEQLARALAVEERAQLAASLLASLQVPPLLDIEALWDREIQARVAAYDRGETQTYAAEDVFAEARRLSR